MIQREDRDGLAILTMARGKANAMNIEFLEAICKSFAEVEQSDARAAVLTAEGKIFSAGVDLPELSAGGEEYQRNFLKMLSKCFAQLAQFPKPVVAAINGHAIAGGCIALLACDYRIVAAGGARIGLTELLVGVPFPTWAFEIARFAVPPQHLQQVMYTGATYPPDAALARGLVDEVIEPARLMERACHVADQLGKIPPEAFQMTKSQIRGPMIERVAQQAPLEDPRAVAAWTSPEAQATIAEFVAKNVKKGS